MHAFVVNFVKINGKKNVRGKESHKYWTLARLAALSDSEPCDMQIAKLAGDSSTPDTLTKQNNIIYEYSVKN